MEAVTDSPPADLQDPQDPANIDISNQSALIANTQSPAASVPAAVVQAVQVANPDPCASGDKQLDPGEQDERPGVTTPASSAFVSPEQTHLAVHRIWQQGFPATTSQAESQDSFAALHHPAAKDTPASQQPGAPDGPLQAPAGPKGGLPLSADPHAHQQQCAQSLTHSTSPTPAPQAPVQGAGAQEYTTTTILQFPQPVQVTCPFMSQPQGRQDAAAPSQAQDAPMQAHHMSQQLQQPSSLRLHGTHGSSVPAPTPSQYLRTPGSTPPKHFLQSESAADVPSLDYSPAYSRGLYRGTGGAQGAQMARPLFSPPEERLPAGLEGMAGAGLLQQLGSSLPGSAGPRYREGSTGPHYGEGSTEAQYRERSAGLQYGERAAGPQYGEAGAGALYTERPAGPRYGDPQQLPPAAMHERSAAQPSALQRKVPPTASQHREAGPARWEQNPLQGMPNMMAEFEVGLQMATNIHVFSDASSPSRYMRRQQAQGHLAQRHHHHSLAQAQQGQQQLPQRDVRQQQYQHHQQYPQHRHGLQSLVLRQPEGARGDPEDPLDRARQRTERNLGATMEGGSGASRHLPLMRHHSSDEATRLDMAYYGTRAAQGAPGQGDTPTLVRQQQILLDQELQHELMQHHQQQQQQQPQPHYGQQQRPVDIAAQSPFLTDPIAAAPSFGMLDTMTPRGRRAEVSAVDLAEDPFTLPSPPRVPPEQPGQHRPVSHEQHDTFPTYSTRQVPGPSRDRGQLEYRGTPYQTTYGGPYEPRTRSAADYYAQQHWEEPRARAIPPRVPYEERPGQMPSRGPSLGAGGPGPGPRPDSAGLMQGYMPDPSVRRSDTPRGTEMQWAGGPMGQAEGRRSQGVQQGYRNNVRTLLGTLCQQLTDLRSKDPFIVVRDMYILIRQFLMQPQNTHLLNEANRYLQTETSRRGGEPGGGLYGPLSSGLQHGSGATEADSLITEGIRGAVVEGRGMAFEAQPGRRTSSMGGAAAAREAGPARIRARSTTSPGAQGGLPAAAGAGAGASPGVKRSAPDDIANPSTRIKRKNMRPLELLLTAGLLSQGDKVVYRSKEGDTKLDGIIQGNSIFVPALDTLMGCTEFEKAAGSCLRRPTQYIVVERTGQTLQELMEQAKPKKSSPH